MALGVEVAPLGDRMLPPVPARLAPCVAPLSVVVAVQAALGGFDAPPGGVTATVKRLLDEMAVARSTEAHYLTAPALRALADDAHAL